MKSARKWKKLGFSTIIWAIIPTLICFAPCFGEDISGYVSGFLLVDGTETDGMVNLLPGADIELGVYVYPNGVLNIYAGTVGPLGITILEPTQQVPGDDPVVTVYGTDFADSSGPLEPGPWTPSGGLDTLTGEYENGDPGNPTDDINLLFYSDVSIILSPPGGQENNPPIANAGSDLTVFTKDIASTVIDGLATDPDEGDSLQYRWLEGSVEFTLWEDVGSNGEAPLDLGTILPQYLGIGTHTLTLEVTDGIDTVSDDMVLTIEIAPVVIDIKPGSYPNSINLGSNGVIPVAILSSSDFDATTIPADTVFLAGSGVAVRGKGNKLMAHEEDVNEDGYIDLVVQVETENLDPGTIQDGLACLKVHETSDPESIVLYEGSDEIIIVPPEG